MAHIISQLLDIAELDSFVVDPDEKADLRSVAAEVAEFVAPLALAQGKDVALLGATEPVWVKGNPEMLGRAIRNLAENAINHTAPGSTVEFVVEARRHSERSRPRTRHRRGRTQSHLSALLAARSQEAGKHGPWAFDRAAHRRTAFRDHHGRKPPSDRRMFFPEIQARDRLIEYFAASGASRRVTTFRRKTARDLRQWSPGHYIVLFELSEGRSTIAGSPGQGVPFPNTMQKEASAFLKSLVSAAGQE